MTTVLGIVAAAMAAVALGCFLRGLGYISEARKEAEHIEVLATQAYHAALRMERAAKDTLDRAVAREAMAVRTVDLSEVPGD